MKLLICAGLLALLFATPPAFAAAASKPETPRTMPVLVIDDTPIGKTPIVTSYADA